MTFDGGGRRSGPGRPTGKFTQHRRLDRLRELLLTRPKGMTIYDIADQLAVTERSVRRYLREVGREYDLETVPERAAGGRLLWRLRGGDIPRKVELRRTQAYALLAARRLFEPMRGSALFEEIDIATKRLFTVAKRPGRGPNAGLADARLDQRFLYQPFAPKDYSKKTDELDDLFQAVSDLRPLTCRYRSGRAGAKEERITIHPYAMVMHRDSIYCIGKHVDRGEIRTFLLDRMRDTFASATERFELPEGFDVDQYFQGEFGIWRSKKKHKVVIEFDAKAAEYVRMRKVHRTQRIVSLPGGGVRLSMTIGDLKEVTSWVLGWGGRAKVTHPPELVEAVEGELREALGRYAARPRRPPRAKGAKKKSKARR